jgi:hypothetical protein
MGAGMPVTNKQKLKLLYLMRILQNETDPNRGLSMPQIIERLAELGISAERKSLYREIDALREIGFDVQTLPTRPVQYVLVRSELTLDDVMMLVDIVQSSRFITERKSNQLVKSFGGADSLIYGRAHNYYHSNGNGASVGYLKVRAKLYGVSYRVSEVEELTLTKVKFICFNYACFILNA